MQARPDKAERKINRKYAQIGVFRGDLLCFKNDYVHKTLNNIVTEAKAYIEAEPLEFNIDALSKAVHISKYHLDRVFKKQIGITPYQFYISDRIKKIRQGLQNCISPSDLAYELNFFDQSHLCNTFKKHMGITPEQYVRSYSSH